MIKNEDAQLIHGNCLEVLKGIPDNSVDSIVTDPPYGLSFMGKKWDYYVPDQAIWEECLRVLKPGGHLLAFAGTRTQHRMAVRIEDAGFEIRDMIAWVYGCLDEQTEVATINGVMPYHKTNVGDLVLCYDATQQTYSYQPILEIVEYEYSDTAYRLIGDFGEQVVSRNHRCIVERGGIEVFEYAEALQRETRVPVLEDLSALQLALHDAHERAGCAKQDVQQSVRGGADRGEEYVRGDAGIPQGANGGLRGMREDGMETGSVVAQGDDANMQPQMQWGATRSGMGDTCAQGQGGVVGGIGSGTRGAHDWTEQSGVEGWYNVSQQEGSVCKSADQVRALPAGVPSDGAQGWVCDGAQDTGGASCWSCADANRSGTPCEPQCDGQPAAKPDAVRNERRAQGIRAWSGHKTAVVRVVPFHYTGKVWCLRVPTGAFVAVRNGVAFPTGNSGFPKSLDVSKAIDKIDAAHARRERQLRFTEWVRSTGLTSAEIDRITGTNMGCHYTTAASQPAVATREHFEKLRPHFGVDVPEWVEQMVDERTVESENFKRREVLRVATGMDTTIKRPGIPLQDSSAKREYPITAPATEAARKWQGWGTALKPALEPITVARKPFKGTVADNVLEWGTGAINIDGCRVGSDVVGWAGAASFKNTHAASQYGGMPAGEARPVDGRWPANLIHDGGYEPTELLGAAARFFYCAKASKKDRGEGNNHPTVKPTDLMAYLCRLVTPPGGVILDPFMGSGSTGKAAMREGFRFIGIEMDAEYLAIAEARIAHEAGKQTEK